MNKDLLLKSLAFLRKGRLVLAEDFIEENPQLYSPMFIYQEYSNDMRIAIDRHIYAWLEKHPSFFFEYSEGNGKAELDEPSLALLINAHRRLCMKFIAEDDRQELVKSEIFDELIKKSINAMDSLLEVSQKYERKLERLRYQSKKSTYLFDKAVADLRMEQK